MSEPNPDDSISARVDMAFIQKVEELSNGKIKINLFTGGKLGDNVQVIQYMTEQKKGIHLARISPASLVTYNCKKSELLDIPYTFANREHFWTFANSDIAQKILNEPYEKQIGVKGLFYMEEGFRHFFSTRELASIEDFKGRKIRSAGNTVMADIITCLGGTQISVGFANIYSALQTGIVDIAEQPVVNYLSNNFHKVAPFMIMDGHQMGIGEVVISSSAWDNLSPKNKEILIKAGKYAGDFCKSISEEAEQNAKKQLEEQGAKFTSVESITPWQKACADVINRALTSDNNQIELYGEIITLAY
ncbi:MAG: TRAP transporter substrate-binding protein [Treponema sp.]|nr:TRAP transporter substrate-binding protein [Treponema sp.]